MSESGEIFNLGDLVWAKMKGFPPWPGRISEPSLDLKKPAGKKSLHCIYFFGSKNYGWIEECHLKDYAKYKDELTKANKSQAFRDAVNAIENYVDNSKEGIVNGTDDVDDIFEKVKNSVSEFSTPKPKRKLIKREITPSSPASVTNTNSSSSSSNSEIKPSPVKRAKLENIIRRDNFPGLRLNADVDRPSQILANHMSLIASRPYEALFSRNLSEPPQENLLSVDLATVSPALKEKNITPSRLLFGFLGLGNMGTGILKNILNSGHRVIIWNRTSDKKIADFLEKLRGFPLTKI